MSEELPGSYLPLLEGTVRDRYTLKRGLDIIGSIIAIILFAPVMLVTAFAVAVSSPGPIIVKQLRLGKNGIPFVFYKFRSMLVNSDDRIHRDYVTSLINGKLENINQGSAARPLYKMVSDPRVTAVGRIIRKASIDELPQLFNVLRGEMSLVGPRPPLSYEVENYQSWHLRRILEAKPGMTGLWQVEGRSRTSFDEMVRMDLRYIQNCSLTFDLKILINTIKVVFRCEGAN
jgi:lipopolysaccharide/colanic/teichoic acid biosynthesis glycosyltransferase